MELVLGGMGIGRVGLEMCGSRDRQGGEEISGCGNRAVEVEIGGCGNGRGGDRRGGKSNESL